MICIFCKKELELLNNSKQAWVEDHQCNICLCENCDTFYAIDSNECFLIKYWFICTEMSKCPEGNYILEFFPMKNQTNIRFLPLDEMQNIQNVCSFDLILPIKPENAAEKIKTYILFS